MHLCHRITVLKPHCNKYSFFFLSFAHLFDTINSCVPHWMSLRIMHTWKQKEKFLKFLPEFFDNCWKLTKVVVVCYIVYVFHGRPSCKEKSDNPTKLNSPEKCAHTQVTHGSQWEIWPSLGSSGFLWKDLYFHQDCATLTCPKFILFAEFFYILYPVIGASHFLLKNSSAISGFSMIPEEYMHFLH